MTYLRRKFHYILIHTSIVWSYFNYITTLLNLVGVAQTLDKDIQKDIQRIESVYNIGLSYKDRTHQENFVLCFNFSSNQ